MKHTRTAFTLIELLVVIAIISILAAILFPVFASAREKSRQVSCASNEKQLALAMVQYTMDFDARYPGYTGFGEGGSWGDPVYPYVKSAGVFHCPDHVDTGSDYLMNGFLGCDMTYNSSPTAPVSNMADGAVSVGSTLCSGPDYEYEDAPGMTASKVALPTITWLFWEGNNYYYTSSGTPYCTTTWSLCPTFEVLNGNLVVDTAGYGAGDVCTGTGPFTSCTYGDQNYYYQNLHHGMNIAYCDGHVKFMTQGQLRTLGTTTPFAGWQNGAAAPSGWHSNGVNDQEPNL